jgi:eukaryotic-like serine/threonine-protein kinase
VPLTLSVADMVLSALAAAHREGLVHRDIKPENVLIGPGGVVKVADFGLVRAVAEASSSTGDVILGTVAYLSPEQVATGAADARSDVYATGVMLFEMLTGAPPYTGETALSVAYRHVNDDMPAPSSTGAVVPAPLDNLIVQATRRDPAARPPSAAAFLRTLHAVRTELDITRVPVPVPAVAPGLAGATVIAPPSHGPCGTRALTRADAAEDPGFPEETAIGVAPSRPALPDDLYRRERTRNRRAFLAWIMIVLMLASAIGLGAWWLGSGRWTVVPNLTGLQRGAVPGALASVGLKADLTEDHSDTAPGNTVIRTDPAPGHRAVRGSDVTVVISLGHPVVPALPAGSTTEEAERVIRQADLSPRLDPGAAQFDNAVPAGSVIGLRPASGTMLTVGAPVTVVTSKGPAPSTVPDVRGLRQAEAVSALQRAGLSVQVRNQFDEQIAGGRAIGTTPGAGTGVARGSSVILLMSTASVVPQVVGLPVGQALQALAEAGLNGTVDRAAGGFTAFGFLEGFSDRVLSQSPAAGQPVHPGATITLTTF